MYQCYNTQHTLPIGEICLTGLVSSELNKAVRQTVSLPALFPTRIDRIKQTADRPRVWWISVLKKIEWQWPSPSPHHHPHFPPTVSSYIWRVWSFFNFQSDRLCPQTFHFSAISGGIEVFFIFSLIGYAPKRFIQLDFFHMRFAVEISTKYWVKLPKKPTLLNVTMSEMRGAIQP